MLECVHCKCPLGVESGELPFTTHDGEVWCPQCFTSKRVHLEPDRYYPNGYMAVRCGKCKLTNVSIGTGLCGQCGSNNVIHLPPKNPIASTP